MSVFAFFQNSTLVPKEVWRPWRLKWTFNKEWRQFAVWKEELGQDREGGNACCLKERSRAVLTRYLFLTFCFTEQICLGPDCLSLCCDAWQDAVTIPGSPDVAFEKLKSVIHQLWNKENGGLPELMQPCMLVWGFSQPSSAGPSSPLSQQAQGPEKACVLSAPVFEDSSVQKPGSRLLPWTFGLGV